MLSDLQGGAKVDARDKQRRLVPPEAKEVARRGGGRLKQAMNFVPLLPDHARDMPVPQRGPDCLPIISSQFTSIPDKGAKYNS